MERCVAHFGTFAGDVADDHTALSLGGSVLWTLLAPMIDLFRTYKKSGSAVGDSAAVPPLDDVGVDVGVVTACIAPAMRLMAQTLAQPTTNSVTRRAAALLLCAVGQALPGILARASTAMLDRVVALVLRLVICSEEAGESGLRTFGGQGKTAADSTRAAAHSIESCMEALARCANGGHARYVCVALLPAHFLLLLGMLIPLWSLSFSLSSLLSLSLSLSSCFIPCV